mmetsp:Transcript_79070/g.211317  ORF Transcript_79070/g.211317 Transcript_79070/m.211317 type:complete len:90 (+) Transcript_79070:752-1021(+)
MGSCPVGHLFGAARGIPGVRYSAVRFWAAAGVPTTPSPATTAAPSPAPPAASAPAPAAKRPKPAPVTKAKGKARTAKVAQDIRGFFGKK